MNLRLVAALGCVALLATCSPKEPERRQAKLPEVANETVKKALRERYAENEVNAPVAASDQRQAEDIRLRAEQSEFKDLGTDQAYEARLRGWINKFMETCDTALYNRCKDAMRKDVNVQAWGNAHRTIRDHLWHELKAAGDSCASLAYP
ncbi:MAG: hypothetical protein M9900_11330 [Flavobacteriales bacterium]|nr:hypothetical protein [Flavobacteriales bacterium]